MYLHLDFFTVNLTSKGNFANFIVLFNKIICNIGILIAKQY